ncbi:Potassium channel subfamily K member 18 [Melipona quadrifasciata]|uniref:Potassium channel subfamily K member 18 n=1 Tax=Melipona quadrifasciata TaxID=166423 RepID=A0A0M8ZWQ9_9HYME|nr:Potassium channel subfamily K member 18 [Melipona quadrifasciata]
MEGNRASCSTSSRNWQRGSYRARDGRRRKRRRKPWGERIADWTRTLIAFLFSNVGIVCLVVGYTIAGAFLFTHIEGRNNLDIVGDVIRLRNVTAATLWELTFKENVFSERIWKAKAKAVLENYQKKMVTAIKNGYDGAEESKRWSFAGAFLYSLTVITTIALNVTDLTEIDLCSMMFLEVASNMSQLISDSASLTAFPKDVDAHPTRERELRKHLPKDEIGQNGDDSVRHNRPAAFLAISEQHWRYSCKELQMDLCPLLFVQMVELNERKIDTFSVDRSTSLEDDEARERDEDDSSSYDPQRVTVPLTLCVAIMVGYIWGGAILFSEWEDWNMLDGSYFCFVSLSTIGFGDIVPGDKIYSAQGLDLSFIFCSMYLMLGMALIAMCFNLMQEEVIAKVRALVRTIKYIFRCDR